jgi:predicted RNA-binding protein with PUA-like domain
MSYWLMKSEPSEFSIDDLVKAKNQTVPWFGVRNYLARNFMRDQMKIGDDVLFYHSSCPEPGIAGLARVSSQPYPDPTQFDKSGKYFDAKATQETPRWMLVDVQLVKKTRLLSLADMRENAKLEEMVVLQRGNRLSITPVKANEWKIITKLLT